MTRLTSQLTTRLTECLNIAHPLVLAPMALTTGGVLAKAVSEAGGLGLIGGGYGEETFLNKAFRDAGNSRVGCGFITWSLAQNPQLLDQVLQHAPAALMLSFGDPAPFATKIKDAGVTLICQAQTQDHVCAALDCGADIVVAQGGEAGGHGALRGTLNFVPETADFLAKHAPETLLLAAGGIADGRGLAASLMLGADGVLMGTRFWASEESLAPKGHLEAILSTCGDQTVQTSTVDMVRQRQWPSEFKIRVRQNAFTGKWHGNEATLQTVLDQEIQAYEDAISQGDADRSAPICGEAIGLINSIEPAGKIVENIMTDAMNCLKNSRNIMISVT